MSAPAIVVEDLAKRYRIGRKKAEQSANVLHAAREIALRPFDYLRAQLREPGEDELLWALKGISFEVPQGEVLGIIGDNGSGKSTLLKILSRITEPTRGLADIRGQVGSLLEVGTGFHPELTGRENVFMNGAILGMRRREIARKFEQIVEFAGDNVARMIDTPVKRYSSGMQVRLGFAVAAHLEPEVLLVDEVLSVGDAAFRRKCTSKIDEVRRGGRTIIFVSHVMDAVLDICSRVAWLERGRIRQIGPAEEVVKAYLAASFKAGPVELADRTDRIGSGAVRFSRVELLDGAGQLLSAVPMGSPVTFRLSYRSEGEASLTGVSLGVVLRDQFRREITRFWTPHQALEFDDLPPAGAMVCTVPRLPVAPGAYRIDLYCGLDEGTADWIEGAAELNVIEGDFFGKGGKTISYSAFLCDHAWSQA